jgi:hypothetical protein
MTAKQNHRTSQVNKASKAMIIVFSASEYPMEGIEPRKQALNLPPAFV